MLYLYFLCYSVISFVQSLVPIYMSWLCVFTCLFTYDAKCLGFVINLQLANVQLYKHTKAFSCYSVSIRMAVIHAILRFSFILLSSSFQQYFGCKIKVPGILFFLGICDNLLLLQRYSNSSSSFVSVSYYLL